MKELWDEAQRWEVGWWGDCTNTFGEEAKQITYAHRMGLVAVPDAGRWPLYDLVGKSVLDLGGGPVSMLLKTCNGANIGAKLTVVDPGAYPDWIAARYAAAGIEYVRTSAEYHDAPERYDECWLYNVLQHVESPRAVIDTARDSASLVRVFEWIDLPPYEGHLHELKASELDLWLGGVGVTERITENGIIDGLAYYGVFV